MLGVGISLPFGLGVLLPRVTSPGREAVLGEGVFCGEQRSPAFCRVPCGSGAALREAQAGRWAAVAGLGVLEEGHSGGVPRAGAS